jgi:hypothetical protein
MPSFRTDAAEITVASLRNDGVCVERDGWRAGRGVVHVTVGVVRAGSTLEGGVAAG